MDEEIKQLLHDVRNPVNTISVNAELGKLMMARNPDPEKIQQIFDTILAECQRCGDLVGQLNTSLSDTE